MLVTLKHSTDITVPGMVVQFEISRLLSDCLHCIQSHRQHLGVVAFNRDEIREMHNSRTVAKSILPDDMICRAC